MGKQRFEQTERDQLAEWMVRQVIGRVFQPTARLAFLNGYDEPAERPNDPYCRLLLVGHIRHAFGNEPFVWVCVMSSEGGWTPVRVKTEGPSFLFQRSPHDGQYYARAEREIAVASVGPQLQFWM